MFLKSFITFHPPLLPDSPGPIEIDDFIFGTTGSLKSKRGYPGQMRVMWERSVHDAVVEMTSNAPVAAILTAIKNKSTFSFVNVNQPNRRITMAQVNIVDFTAYLNEPKKIMLHFLGNV